MKQFTFLALVFFSSCIYGQNIYQLNPNGKLEVPDEEKKSSYDILLEQRIDTIGFNHAGYSDSTIFTGRDYILQWFTSPANLKIKRIAFYINDYQYNWAAMENPIIVKMNWDETDYLDLVEGRQGYYIAEGNGFNNITAFIDNPDRTGEWVSTSPKDSIAPIGEDLWRSFFYPPYAGWNLDSYTWYQMSVMYEPQLNKDEIFGVAILNTSEWDSVEIAISSDEFGFPGWKFYSNGRYHKPPDPNPDYGWWVLPQSFDFLVEVEILGNPPIIKSVTFPDTVLAGVSIPVMARLTDVNNSVNGIQNVYLQWRNRDQTFNSVEMVNTNQDLFMGEIPSQTIGSEIWFKIIATDTSEESINSPMFYKKVDNPSAVIFENLPTQYNLSQNYPNPFNPSTTIDYDLQVSSQVTLKIFDILGREIETLVDEFQQAGSYHTKFLNDSELPSGVYFYRLNAAGEEGDFISVKKMLLLK